ncbi:MAG: iron ABC transporter permease [Eubacterium sp.]|nr:iron ABC transporter permease [Eubacterium sp.]
MDKNSASAKRIRRYLICFICMTIVLMVLFLMSVKFGSIKYTWSEVLDALRDRDSVKGRIVVDIRLPRVIAAILLGGALGIAGFMLQSFFNNPIAGPFVLGISSGAKLAVAIVMILFIGSGNTVGSYALIIAAFLGSLLSMFFILLVSRKTRNSAILIVCGVMIGYICSAVTELLINFAADSDIVNLHSWSMGSFSGISWDNIRVMMIIVVLGVAAAFLMSKPMEAYSFGENYARSMGVNIKRFRMIMIIISSILSACVTAFAGPISFLGVAVPHLMRSIFKTAKPRIMVPACFIGGAIFCLFSDFMARVLFAPTEISVSTVTSILGAPVIIIIMLSRKRRV